MRGSWLIGTCVLLLVACAPLESRAAAPVTVVFAAGGETPHESKELNVFKGGLDLTIWSIVVFLSLFFILGKFAWPSIREGLDKREQSIAHDKLEGFEVTRLGKRHKAEPVIRAKNPRG